MAQPVWPVADGYRITWFQSEGSVILPSRKVRGPKRSHLQAGNLNLSRVSGLGDSDAPAPPQEIRIAGRMQVRDVSVTCHGLARNEDFGGEPRSIRPRTKGPGNKYQLFV